MHHGDAIRYRLLGPVQLGARTPSATKVRVVAATLLIRANETVSADCLIEELWGEHPPRTATTTLQVYMSQLRKALAPETEPAPANGPIVTRPPGYLFRVGPGELDLANFERLRDLGRAAIKRGDHAVAVSLLREAAGLWTGPPLADIPHGPVLMSAAARLQELRLDVVEHLYATELRLGHHREIVTELLELADQHPLRERLTAQLMLTLHRCDRHADALRVFGRIRRRLAEELGTDPGAELRELHQRILRFDPGLDWRGPVTVQPAEPVVWLPRPVADFVGRDEELARAVWLLRQTGPNGTRVLSIAGASGVGKTAFAVTLAHRLGNSFPDGRIFVGLRNTDGAPLDARQSVLRLLRAFPASPRNEHGDDLQVLLEALQRTISGRRLLIVLDDVVSEAQIRGIVEATGESTLLITSRRILAAVDGAQHVVLTPLAPPAADLLLIATGGVRMVDDPAAASRIAQLCGYLPLALRVAGAGLAAHPQWTAETLARRLEDERARLSVLAVGDLNVRANLLVGYRDVSPDAQRAVRLLGVAPTGDTSAWAASALLGTPPEVTDRLLAELVQAQLLEYRPSAGPHGRFGFHVLLRALAVELAAEETPASRAAAIARWCRAALAFARYADEQLAPGRALHAATDAPDDTATEHADLATAAEVVADAPLRWFDTEAPGLVAAVRQAHQAGLWPLVWRLADALSGYFEVTAGWSDWDLVLDLARDAAQRAQDARAEAVVLLSRGDLARQRRLVAAAAEAYERARQLARGNRVIEARGMIGLADVALERDHVGQARQLYAQGLVRCRAVDDVRGATDALRGLALVELRRGAPDAALRRFAECGRSADQLGDPRWREFAQRVADRVRREAGGAGPAAIEIRPGVWTFAAAA